MEQRASQALLEEHGSARVLVVDDQPANVAMIDYLLRRAGLVQVAGLTDPREVVGHCLDRHVDLVLLDLHMPGFSGLDVLASLRARMPADTFLPVIMLTGDQSAQVREQALAAGATDFLTKPFSPSEVALRVRNLLTLKALHTRVQRANEGLGLQLASRVAMERRSAEERRLLVERIEAVLDDRNRRAVYQPIVDLEAGSVVGYEALTRFLTEPVRTPDVWFEEAVSVGCGTPLELAAARSALAVLPGLAAGTFLSINVSPATVNTPELIDLVETQPAGRVVLELTEHDPVVDYEPLLETLAYLRSRGVRVAIDDAGAGYAGLRHLLNLRPDVLKLDLSLTRDIDQDPARRALATTMVSLAEEIGAQLVAEGIETAEELRTLRELGIPLGQGFHLARPASLPLHATRPGD